MTISTTDSTKTTLAPNNFGKQNTPKWAVVTGDWLLRIGLFGGALVGLPAMLPTAAASVVPAIILTKVVAVGWGAVIVGLLGKSFMKMFGETPTTDTSNGQ